MVTSWEQPPVRPGELSKRLSRCRNTLHNFLLAPDQKHWTEMDGQVSNSSSNYPPRDNQQKSHPLPRWTIEYYNRRKVHQRVLLIDPKLKTEGEKVNIIHEYYTRILLSMTVNCTGSFTRFFPEISTSSP